MRRATRLSGWLAVLLVSAASFAQAPPSGDAPALSFGSEQAGLLGGFGGGAGGDTQHVEFSGQFKLKPQSREGVLSVTATLEPRWHVYSTTQKPGGPMPSKLEIVTKGVSTTGNFTADHPPHVKTYEWFPVPAEEFPDLVTWSVPIRLDEGVDPESLDIVVRYDGQVCEDEGSCIPLDNVQIPVKFAGTISEADLAAVLQPPRSAGGPRDGASGQAQSESNTSTGAVTGSEEAVEPVSAQGLLMALAFGFVGGCILNLMPCVLPVIGLKIMSFAQQAGMQRSAVFKLNLWFTLGLLTVFWLLAAASVLLFVIWGEQLNWGEQFTYTWFKVAMTGLVFAMALSFLGVWEIPLPGFVGAGKANELQKKEGPSGAFFKGVFTTILATPCSGPFLGPIFAYTVGRPPAVTVLLFTSIGLGMASPYLLIGAFPSLARFLPKPGAWMETLKESMGFILLATVVWLFSMINSDYFIATLTLIMGLWLACWLVGRISPAAESGARLRGWLKAVTVATAIGLFAFTMLVPKQHEPGDKVIPWQPFSPAALAEARASGKPVLVEFTADWCPTCKWNLWSAINTDKVQQLIDEREVVPLLADWTDRNEEIKQALLELNSKSIPLLAIYPAGGEGEPIVLRDLVRESQVLKAIHQAAPPPEQSDTVRTAAVP